MVGVMSDFNRFGVVGERSDHRSDLGFLKPSFRLQTLFFLLLYK